MIKTILVWYLVSYGSGSVLSWSPPMSSAEECERVRAVVYDQYNRGRCVQIKELVK